MSTSPKLILRKSMRQLLTTILPTQVEEESAYITKTVLGAEYYAKCTHFCVYLPAKMHLTKSNLVGAEIDTVPLINAAVQSKKCFVPFLPAGVTNAVMNMVQVTTQDNVDAFPVDKWGIPYAPESEQRLDSSYFIYLLLFLVIQDIYKSPDSYVLIVIPGLAFDSENHRLGRGKGHYDRFLKRVMDACKASNSQLECTCNAII